MLWEGFGKPKIKQMDSELRNERTLSNEVELMADTLEGELMADTLEGVTTPEISNKIRQIIIKEVNRGYIVQVGCHTFAISTKAELTTKLIEYIDEPAKTEKKWFTGNLF